MVPSPNSAPSSLNLIGKTEAVGPFQDHGVQFPAGG